MPRKKFVQFLEKNIEDLENTGKHLEESLYAMAEENIVNKGELGLMIEKKKDLLIKNEKLMENIKKIIARKGDHYYQHQQKMKSLKEHFIR